MDVSISNTFVSDCICKLVFAYLIITTWKFVLNATVKSKSCIIYPFPGHNACIKLLKALTVQALQSCSLVRVITGLLIKIAISCMQYE
jgi:hypothetical protein